MDEDDNTVAIEDHTNKQENKLVLQISGLGRSNYIINILKIGVSDCQAFTPN